MSRGGLRRPRRKLGEACTSFGGASRSPGRPNRLAGFCAGLALWACGSLRDTSNIDSVFVAGRGAKRAVKLDNVDLNVLEKMVIESRDYVVRRARFRLPRSRTCSPPTLRPHFR